MLVLLSKATARALQRARYKSLDGIRTNADADGALLEQVAAPDAAGRTLLTEAMERTRPSARQYHRVLRVAEALFYRRHSTGV